ncbi:MAG: SDR family oxidoreductase [Myxococcota bacterium]
MTERSTKVFVLTGCASGIGLRMAKVLADAGHRLVVTDVQEDRLREVATSCAWPEEDVFVRKLDVRQPHAWDLLFGEALRHFGRVDVLMNIAGYLRPGYIHEIGVGDVDKHVDVNLKGVVFGTHAAARVMVDQGHGHIVNIGSLASLAPVPGLCLYSASKFAVRGFSLACAQELRPHGVHVSVVLPDAVKTPMLDLQLHYEEAAMTFSGDEALTVDDVVSIVLERVLPQRPMEVMLPLGRGSLAKFANAFPEVAVALGPALTKKGLQRQKELKRGAR